MTFQSQNLVARLTGLEHNKNICFYHTFEASTQKELCVQYHGVSD